MNIENALQEMKDLLKLLKKVAVLRKMSNVNTALGYGVIIAGGLLNLQYWFWLFVVLSVTQFIIGSRRLSFAKKIKSSI